MATQAQIYSENFRFPASASEDGMQYNKNNELFFNFQQKQQQHMMQQNQNLCFGNSFVGSVFKNNCSVPINNLNVMSSDYSQGRDFHLQRQEIDQYIRLQNDRLRLELQEQRRQEVALLLKKIESKTHILLRQKDQQIAQAANRTIQLQTLLKKLEMEKQTWQKVAQQNEAMAVSLNNTLEQLRDRACCSVSNGAEDTESCCDCNNGDREAEEKTGEETEQRIRKTMMLCKNCDSRRSCVMFLPCRHLCSCKTCEAFLDCCPVCQTVKNASIEIEAFIF